MANQGENKITSEAQDEECNEVFIQRMKRAIDFSLTLKKYIAFLVSDVQVVYGGNTVPILQVKTGYCLLFCLAELEEN